MSNLIGKLKGILLNIITNKIKWRQYYINFVHKTFETYKKLW